MKNNLETILLMHYEKYPYMDIQDFIKLIFQNEFAGGHMISNLSQSLKYLEDEYSLISHKGNEFEFDDIENGLTRIYLNTKFEQLKLSLINKMFFYTSNKNNGNLESFLNKVETLKSISEKIPLGFNKKDIDLYMENYKKTNYTPVSHSKKYKELYKPHYRVVDVNFKHYIKVFKEIERLKKYKKKIIIGIDGNSGSGKSFLGGFIKEIYNCNLFHSDDFFLMEKDKTEERLSEVGGNIDYVRLKEELINNLNLEESFTYGKYNCQSGEVNNSNVINNTDISIVEGVYSHHAYFNNPYDIKIFLHTSQDIQEKRILKRSSEYMLNRFIKDWIPLEELYFENMNIKHTSNIVINTDDFFV